ncbi:5442_t:CDS:1, partial [Paraglomus occultum]
GNVSEYNIAYNVTGDNAVTEYDNGLTAYDNANDNTVTDNALTAQDNTDLHTGYDLPMRLI